MFPNIEQLKALVSSLGDTIPSELSELLAFFESAARDGLKIEEVSEAEPLAFASNTYLQRITERMKELGKFTSEDIALIVRHARAYAGGVASGAARRKTEPEVVDALAASEGFMQYAAFTDLAGIKVGVDKLTPWVQITPSAGGKFTHPRYGDITFSHKLADDLIANFRTEVYQRHIPIDAEHETKLSGAHGYYREVRKRTDGAVEARIELTERGQRALESGQFRYFSPELFWEWTDPGTGQKFNNVLIGGAFTTRPYFKDRYLKEVLAANEYEVWTASEPTTKKGTGMSRFKTMADGSLELDAKGEPILTDEAKEADEKAAQAALAAAEADAVKKFRDEHKLGEDGKPIEETNTGDGSKSFAEQYPEEWKRLQASEERASRLEAEAQAARFNDIVGGRGEDSSGMPWVGGKDEHLTMLGSLAKAFGEDSTEFKTYVSQQDARATEAQKSGMFSERGSSSRGSASTKSAEDLAAERFKTNPAKAFHEHLAEVLSEKPELYEEHRREVSTVR
jgi:hypothetical protein